MQALVPGDGSLRLRDSRSVATGFFVLSPKVSRGEVAASSTRIVSEDCDHCQKEDCRELRRQLMMLEDLQQLFVEMVARQQSRWSVRMKWVRAGGWCQTPAQTAPSSARCQGDEGSLESKTPTPRQLPTRTKKKQAGAQSDFIPWPNWCFTGQFGREKLGTAMTDCQDPIPAGLEGRSGQSAVGRSRLEGGQASVGCAFSFTEKR